MLGLIKKDLLTIKGNLKVVILFVFVFTILALQGKQDMSFLSSFICVMLFMSTFSYDEYNNWNAYAVTLPNGRKNVVKAKYVASILLILISVLFTSVLSIVVGVVNDNFSIEQIITITFGGFVVASIIQSILYPLIFKYGVEKGRIALFVLVFVLVALFGFILNDVDINTASGILKLINDYWFIFLPLISVGILFMSYMISKKIFSKKEF